MIPLPLLLLLGAGGLYMATRGDDAPEDTPTPPASEEPPQDDLGEPGDDPGAPIPRSSEYGTFMSSYAATPFHNAIAQAERDHGIPENLLARTIYQESAFDPNAASESGDVGIAQFQPATADDLGIDPTDPSQAIPAAARYLRGLREQTGSWQAALVAYNWGIGRVQKYGANAAPASTRNYAAAILADSERT